MLNWIKKFWYLIGKKDRFKFLLILFSMFLSGIMEMLGVGIIFPFVALMVQPELMQKSHLLSLAYEKFPLHNRVDFFIFMVCLLIMLFLVKNIFLFFSQLVQIRFAFSKFLEYSTRLFKAYLYSPYVFHLQRNTPKLMQHAVGLPVNLAVSVMLPLFMCLTEGIMIIVLFLFLLWFDISSTLVIASVLGGSVYVFYRIIKHKARQYGEEHHHNQALMNQQVLHGFGSIKESKILHCEPYFIKKYTEFAKLTASTGSYGYLIPQVPRLFVEFIAVSIVLIVMLTLVVHGDSTAEILVKLSVFGMAAVRLLPSLTRMVGAMATVRSNISVAETIYHDLKEGDKLNQLITQKSEKGLSLIPFNHAIELEDVSYQYEGSEHTAISHLTVSIPKYASVAFVGGSGAGKTTTVDLILGLLEPNGGKIKVDGFDVNSNIKAWQRHLGYIPQTIYLTDDTIKHNIAFGLEDTQIDEIKLNEALHMSQLYEFVNSLPHGVNTIIGEGGARLSGGQRQRIGIARALYHSPDVLVMDEATAALDNQTEQEVVKAINNLSGKKTLIIIAHRLSTVRHCDILYFMEAGQVIDSGSFDELLNKNEKFRKLAGGIK